MIETNTHNNNPHTLGNKIRELREKLKLSQLEFSKKIGVSKSALGHWEIDRRVPNIEKLVAIAKLGNVPLDYFAASFEYDTYFTDDEKEFLNNSNDSEHIANGFIDHDSNRINENKKSADNLIELSDTNYNFSIDSKFINKEQMIKIVNFARGVVAANE